MITWESFLGSFDTGSGIWNPLVWVLSIIFILLIVYSIRRYGKTGYKEKTDQTQSFLSGNPEYEKEQMHIKASNMYWGFTESLKFVYKILDRMHTGNVSDYVLWFVIVLGCIFVLIGVI